MLQDKPYLTLELDISGCSSDIHVNGARAFYDFTGNPVKVEVPVNHWLQPGKNSISVTAIYFSDDPKGEEAEISATLKVKKSGTQSTTSIPITSLSFNGKAGTSNSSPSGRLDSNKSFTPFSEGDVAVSEVSTEPLPGEYPGIIVSRSISLPLDLPHWAFLKSDFIADKAQLLMGEEEFTEFSSTVMNELFPIYNYIYKSLKAGNVEVILPLFEERNKEIEQAFYYSKGKMSTDLAYFLKESALSGDWELAEISPELLHVHMYPNRKLIRLMGSDGSPAIIFNRTDGSMHETYDIVFRKSGNKWIITR